MNFVDSIIKKRDGGKLTKEEIAFFVKGVTDGTLPDYQISALLMAIFLKGMDTEETAQLTMEMAHSGGMFDLSALAGCKVDKHSTGGVADTTTLILAPLVASVDVPVVKMSGRGLGFSGGTIDKLESIPGFRVDVTEEEALRFAKESGIVLMSQTDNLTPADKKLYALRDVTGTVDSIPLIAASIMSKKIAAGADAIVLDVKCGSGAFMKNAADAERLAGIMADMGRHVGRRVTAVISSMAQPLGMYIGNSLEVMEAIEVLKGNVGGDLLEVSLTLGANMLLLAERVQSEEEGKGAQAHIVALDGVAIVVNPENTVEDLTVDQIAQIFKGEITNWKDLGGADEEIAVYGREAGSGTRGAFEELVGVEDACKYLNEYSSTGDVIGNVASNPSAIGYASLSAVSDNVKAVKVNGVDCTEATVQDGTYEIQRPFVMITKDGTQLSDAAQAFLDFAMSADAASLIAQAGAVPPAAK